jgi:auxin influx carrier (AUX1 LAX family)
MPNAVAAYHTYGALARDNANAFALFPQSMARDLGIVMMTIHQGVAFGLFAGPLFHMWEKLLGVHNLPFRGRSVYRIPLVACMVLLAVAFPFFGAINAVLGAFTTSFGTYIIPTVAYNLAFPDDNDASTMIKKPPQWIGLKGIRMVNWAIAIFVLVAGVGAGGYFSLKKFVDQIHQFEYFAECYQCY